MRTTMRMTMVAGVLVGMGASLGTADDARASTPTPKAAPRYGLREACDDAAGWYQWDKDRKKVPPRVKSIASKDGTLVIECRRSLLRFARNFSWVAPGTYTSAILRKDYGQVDLDTYRYMTCRIVSKGSGVFIGINGFDTKLGYTTGLTVIDLHDYDIKGAQPVRLELDLHENSTTFVLDELALVSELTAEEKRAFIPKGAVPATRDVKAKPYHGLEAIRARCGAPSFPLARAEQAIFRDTATGAVLTRLTASPFDDGFTEGGIWSADGACLFFEGRGRGGLPIYHLADGRIQAGPTGASKKMWSPIDANILYFLNSRGKLIDVKTWDRRTGRETLVATITPTRSPRYIEFGATRKTGRITVAFREADVAYVVDPRKPEGECVEEIRLPTRLKGFSFTPDETKITWANCYTYERRYRDLKTGREGIGCSYSVGHSCHDGSHTVGNFGRHLKILIDNNRVADRTPGGRLKIWANYGADVVTDYGRLTHDAEWIITNGVRGQFANQHVMIPRSDPASVLRLTRYFTTYYDWGSATYSRPSPDYTKVVFISDWLDNPDLWMVTTRRPDPPLAVTCKDGSLSWAKPKRSAEIAGYNVYRTTGRRSGRDYVRINDQLITDMKYAVPVAGAGASPRYALTAVEHSGLEGVFSDEVAPGRERVAFPPPTPADGLPRFVTGTSAADPRDATPPERPANFKAVALADGRVQLTWDASKAKDFGHFTVYAGDGPDLPVGNRTVIRSTKGTGIVDTGVAPGKTAQYKLIAYDTRMNASKAASASVAIPGKPLLRTCQVEDFPADHLKTVAGPNGVTYVTARQKGEGGHFDITVDVPQGHYRLWLDYAVPFYRRIPVDLLVDGKLIGQSRGMVLRGNPATLSRPKLSPKTAHMFSDPLRHSMDRDTFGLSAGKHVIRVRFAYEKVLFDKVHLTNDASWRPKAYDAFVRPRLKGKLK